MAHEAVARLKFARYTGIMSQMISRCWIGVFFCLGTSLWAQTPSTAQGWSRVPELPLRFLEPELREGPQPRLSQKPDWQPELFKTDPELQKEARQMAALFLGLNNRAMFQCRAAPDQEWTTPLQLITSSPEPEAKAMLLQVNTTALPSSRTEPLPGGLARHFDVVDLWGCEGGPRCTPR